MNEYGLLGCLDVNAKDDVIGAINARDEAKKTEFKSLDTVKMKLSFKVSNVSNGVNALHRFIMTEDGSKIYGIGRNHYNQIGIKSQIREGRFIHHGYYSQGGYTVPTDEEFNFVHKFTPIDHFIDNGIKMKKIECGLNFTIFLSQNGNVYYHGISGLNQWNDEWRQQILDINTVHKVEGVSNIEDVCCTEENILLLQGNGDVFEWNYLFDEEIRIISPFKSVIKISAGHNHSVLLDKNGNALSKKQKLSLLIQRLNGNWSIKSFKDDIIIELDD